MCGGWVGDAKATSFTVNPLWEGSGRTSGASSSSTRRYERHEVVGGTRSCTGHLFYFQLVPTLGPSTCVQTPLGVRTPQLDSPFSLEQQLRAQYKFGKPVGLCWSPGGEPRCTPLRKTICIHSLSACIFPVRACTNLFKTLPIFMHRHRAPAKSTPTAEMLVMVFF